ncbi:PIN-like domain-containing protein [Photobacterium kishitanii]|uniref:PIN-like domain-containing protein n=1 Tax=Photobacterium kishitanii TaxID=318456 RepID=UPI000D15D2AC|nr:PIN-like domain-containing protein [Photobacterium kishitanii]PSU23149.1 peptidase C14 [Photobacterium kishitanii]
MRLGYYGFDTTIEEHHKKIAEIVQNKTTLIFFDTNILAYLYKLHANARNEFYAWSDSVINDDRLFLPGWAASEYSNRVTADKLGEYTNKNNNNVSPEKAKKMYHALYQMASLFVDDDILVDSQFKGSREQFLDEFLSTINSLDKYTRAFKTQFKVGDVHNEITKHFSEVVLNSNLTELCAKANREGDTRFEHRLPPGFKDGGKGENRFGDLIIWYEILSKSKELKEKFDHVLFLSNDEKLDWVYAPKFRENVKGGNRKLVANKNPVIKIVDPRLVAEFSNTVGHSNFTICSLALLIESLSKIESKRFTNLAGAIQINIQESASPAEEAIALTEEVVAPAEEVIAPVEEVAALAEEVIATVEEVAAPAEVVIAPVKEDAALIEEDALVFRYDQEALQDSLYQADAPSEINEIIRDLKSYNWYTQNPAISKIGLMVGKSIDASSLFVLGRNIYQAACGNSQKASEYMASLRGKLGLFSNGDANHILAGMAFEIYFDSSSQYRETVKFDYASNVLSLLSTDNFIQAKRFIRRHLQDYEGQLLFIPGDQGEPKEEITINVSLSDDDKSGFVLNSVMFQGKELIDDDEEDYSWWFVSDYNASKIRDEISSILAIPVWALTLKLNEKVGEKSLKLPDGKLLAPLNATKK